VSKGKASSSFLKKRTKKLLSVSGGISLAHLNPRRPARNKSFLFLFFKKEILPCSADGKTPAGT
jgi:hypothetical protein